MVFAHGSGGCTSMSAPCPRGNTYSSVNARLRHQLSRTGSGHPNLECTPRNAARHVEFARTAISVCGRWRRERRGCACTCASAARIACKARDPCTRKDLNVCGGELCVAVRLSSSRERLAARAATRRVARVLPRPAAVVTPAPAHCASRLCVCACVREYESRARV